MKRKSTATAGMVTIMIRVPARIHKAMLRIKRDEGVSMQTQVMVRLKAAHDADGKAART